MTILMFDIDGTLSHSQGAGTLAMSRAFEELWGINDALDGMNFAGRSDSWIVPTALAKQGRDCSAEQLASFQDVYIRHLADALVERNSQLCPGVVELLDALQDYDAVIGLGTGNFRRAAEAKLAPLGIWDRFVDGGFGDDHAVRTELLMRGLERLRPYASADAEVVVIGDTINDIEAGHDIGAKVVAVKTGYAQPGDLDAADAILDDLSNLGDSLSALFD